MDDDERAPGSGARSRVRKPTPEERRAQRAQVEDPAAVLESGARFLEARPRSVAEVRRKLSRLGYRLELVTGAVERLAALGFLDDEAFAHGWVESRDRARPRGEHALRRELGIKGVDKAIVDAVLGDRREEALGAAEALDELPASPDDAAAERLLRRKLAPILRETDPRKRGQRAYALLARNGFGPDVCAAVSRRVLAGVGTETDEADQETGSPAP
ncbi:MAG TPA: regulatory protein RecX [Candidatus Limnocylindrales bacterium]